MEDRIHILLTPIAQQLGVDVLKISIGGGHHQQLLRVIIDKRGGVCCEDMERISRALSLQLDAEDMISDRYRLEVSSPGLSWPLKTATDFDRHEGEWLKIQYADGTVEEGRNAGAVDNGLQVQMADGEIRNIRLSDTVKVVRMIQWK